MRGPNFPQYGRQREVQRVPVDTEVLYVEMKAIEDVKTLMRELQPRRVDSDSQALLRICGRYYN
jgi:hypothetical protein